MNTRLLRKVAKHISEEPQRLNMAIVLRRALPEYGETPECGTVGCIAGWACFLSGHPEVRERGGGWFLGMELLGLTSDQAERLFDPPTISNYAWPKKFALAYVKARTPRKRAEITAKRIEHFIATKGKE